MSDKPVPKPSMRKLTPAEIVDFWKRVREHPDMYAQHQKSLGRLTETNFKRIKDLLELERKKARAKKAATLRAKRHAEQHSQRARQARRKP